LNFFELISEKGLEQLVFCNDDSVGLKAIIAVHNTLLGPALAPIRIKNYTSEEEAVGEAVNLAKNMTYRAAIADCDLGGASAVIWADPAKDKSEAFFRAFGRFIQRFSDHLYVVMGVGTEPCDLQNIKRETNNVLAQSTSHGGIADPKEMTGESMMEGLRATARELTGKADLKGVSCLVQGLGNIGSVIVRKLTEAGAIISVTDLNYDRIKKVQDMNPEITMVSPEETFEYRCDIIVPCAPPPGVIKKKHTENLKCKAIAGASSFVVQDLETADALHKRGIICMPHFVMDSGEAIQADYELKGVHVARLEPAIKGTYKRMRSIQEEAAQTGESPLRTALRKAQERLTSIGNIGRRNAW
jgi:leucine dehydrogenase